MWLQILGGIAVVLVVLVLALLWKLRAPPLIFPGPPKTNFIMGNYKDVLAARKIGEIEPYFIKMFHTYGRTFNLAGFGGRSIGTMDPEFIRQVNAKRELWPTKLFADALSIICSGLLGIGGEKWARHRSLCQKAFTIGTLKSVVDATNDYMNTVIAEWNKKCGNGQSFNGKDTFELISVSVLSKVVFGTDPIAALTESLDTLMKAVSVRVDFPRFLWPFIFKDQANVRAHQKKLWTLVKQLIENQRKHRAEHPTEEGKCLLEMMMTQSVEEGGLNEQELFDETVMFYGAGQETTSTALAFTLAEMARHPEIVERMYEEVSAVCGPSGPVTWEQVHDLQYVEMVIKEALRMYPVVPAYARHTMQTEQFMGKTLPEDTQIFVDTFAVHRDPEYWVDPETFNPDRFREVPRANTYVPFGGGARMCIGNRFAMLEMKTVIAHLVRNYTFKWDESKPFKLFSRITLSPEGGVHVFINRRK